MQQQEQQDQQNPRQNQQQDKKKTQKKRKKPFALKPQHFETEKGLKKLYQLTNQINWNDPMTIQSAMNLVTVTLKSWHNQFAPKYSYDYFLQRCQALGSHKLTGAYMNKVRRIHKGVQQWDHTYITPGGPNTLQKQENNQNINNKDYQNQNQNQKKLQQDKQNQLQRLKIAEQLGKDHVQQMDNLNIGDEVDEMMEEDLRMFEAMSRKKKLWAQQEQEEQGIDLGADEIQFQPSDYE